jgi:hypothetical protein
MMGLVTNFIMWYEVGEDIRMTGRSIFRNKAMQHYLQSREKTILPLFVAPPVFAFYWLLLGIFLMSGLIAWFGQVPLYATGPGLISAQSTSVNQNNEQAIALIFLPASSSLRPQPGWSALVQVGLTGPPLNGTVDTIKPGVLSPSEVQKQYSLKVLTSVIVVSVKLGVQVARNLDTGSPVSAQIQVGSQRLLALFPVINTLLKDK